MLLALGLTFWAIVLPSTSHSGTLDSSVTIGTGEVSCAGDVPLDGCKNQYFIDSAASDGGDGLSLATAWNELSDIGTLPTGSDVCFLGGSVFENETLTVNWSGTAEDRAIIGTCYEGAGPSGTGTWWGWHGPFPELVIRAEVNGSFDDACIAAGETSCKSGPQVPSGGNSDGLVTINGDYVTLRKFNIHDSAARGININAPDNVQSKHVHLIELNMDNMYGSNFFNFQDGSVRAIIRNNTFTDAGYRWSNWWSDSGGGIGGNCFILGRGSHYQADGSAYAIIEGNMLLNCSGEGLTPLQTSNSIIRGNYILNVRNVGIYLDVTANNVVEWNIVSLLDDNCDIYSQNSANCLSGSGQSAQGQNSWVLEGYPPGCDGTTTLCAETYDGGGNIVRHNLIVWGEEGWGGGMENGPRDEDNDVVGGDFINNTIYKTTLLRTWSERFSTLQQLDPGQQVTNNVFVESETGTPPNPRCFSAADSPTYSDNVWEVTQANLDNDCEGAGDEYGSEPTFASPDTSGPPTFANRPTLDDYVITSGAGNSTGTDLSADPLADISSDCVTTYPQFYDLNPTGGQIVNWLPTCANWRMKAYYDKDGNARGATPDKGI